MPATSAPFTTLHPERKAARALTAEDLWNLPRVGAPDVFPDGTQAVVPVTRYDLEKNEGRTQLHVVSLMAAGEPRAITAADVSASEPRVSPDGKQLAFIRKDANGKGQLHVMPLDGGEARRVTSLPLGAFDPTWLPDGSGLIVAGWLLKGFLTPEATTAETERRTKDPVKAYVTEDRVFRFWDTWLTTGEVPHLFSVDLKSGTVRDLAPSMEYWFDWNDPSGQYDLSPDAAEIAFAGSHFDAKRSLLITSVFTLSVATGTITRIAPEHPGDDMAPRYSPDGHFIVHGRTMDPEFYADRTRLMRYDRSTRVSTEWLAGWDLSPAHWSFADDGTLVFEAEQDARVRVFTFSGTGAPKPLTDHGTVSGTTVGKGGRVVFTQQSLAAPSELYAIPLAGGAATRLTRFTDDVAARFGVGEVREMRFAGCEGEPVQMFVVLPPGYVEGRKYPLVHVIHGGPHGITADMFHPRWNGQLFAAPGYIAAMVNFQGSTSWGQDYAQRIQGEWGRRPFEDIMKGTDALIATGMVDETRMAATGGSYGGYMAAWIAGHTDRFKCIINHAGVADLAGQYASDVTQGRGRASGGEAWDGLEKQDAWSPVRFAADMTTPMLVIHGERDYRVPVGQGLLIYGVLKAKGVPARLVYFPDENHWILKPRNSLLWYREVHDWLARYLKPAS